MRILKTNAMLSLLAAVSIAVAPGLAFADNSTAVINSGDHASVNSATNQSSSVAVSNSNTASVEQSVHANSNTGNNTANGNIGLGGVGSSIMTGSANVGTMMGVSANTNVTNVSGAVAPAASNGTDVVNTGDHANVNTSANTSNAVDVYNSNAAYVGQAVHAASNTGGNTTNSNIGGSSIVTGSANVGTTMGVDVNHNLTSVGGVGAGLSPLANSLMNGTSVTNTGDHSTVNSTANSNSSVGVANSNTALVDQLVHGMSNSGYNHSNSNIGGGVIGTGLANVGTTMGVGANTNLTGVGDEMGGSMSGHNMQDIVNTGDSLHTNTSVNQNSTLGVSNSQYLSSSQFEWSHSNTGANTTSSNVGGGLIGAGGANAGATFGLTGNTNVTSVGGLLGGLLSLIGMH